MPAVPTDFRVRDGETATSVLPLRPDGFVHPENGQGADEHPRNQGERRELHPRPPSQVPYPQVRKARSRGWLGLQQNLRLILSRHNTSLELLRGHPCDRATRQVGNELRGPVRRRPASCGIPDKPRAAGFHLPVWQLPGAFRQESFPLRSARQLRGCFRRAMWVLQYAHWLGRSEAHQNRIGTARLRQAALRPHGVKCLCPRQSQ